jgi:hypothetical protein
MNTRQLCTQGLMASARILACRATHHRFCGRDRSMLLDQRHAQLVALVVVWRISLSVRLDFLFGAARCR